MSDCITGKGIKWGPQVFHKFGIFLVLAAITMIGFSIVFWIKAEVAQGIVIGKFDAPSLAETENHATTPPTYSADTVSYYFESVDRAQHLQVEFRVPDGSAYSFRSDWEGSVYSPGDVVSVLYLPDDPATARIYGFKALFLGPLMLLLMGVVFWFLGALTIMLVSGD